MFVTPEQARQLRDRAQSRPLSRHQQLHLEADRRGWTRRQFLQMGAAVVAAGGATVLSRTALAAPPGSGLPEQIPYHSPFLEDALGLQIPFFLPAEVDPFSGGNGIPTTIHNFNGFLGLVEADGVSNPDNTADDEPRLWACDVRFMKGVFVNRSGHKQPGAFAFF